MDVGFQVLAESHAPVEALTAARSHAPERITSSAHHTAHLAVQGSDVTLCCTPTCELAPVDEAPAGDALPLCWVCRLTAGT
jgi:hypothetical protein